MTREDINDIIKTICPNDEDFEKVCISPAYLKKELEALALEQEPCEDCISRKALTDTTICEGISCNECSFNTCEDGQSGCLLKERVDKLPPVIPQPSEDCISRQGVINAINQNCIFENEYNLTASRIKNLVQQMPPVTTQPKMGRWIKYGIPRCGEQHYKCTSCGYYINFGQWGEVYTKEFKYCPNCGAKMEVEE